MNTKIFVNRTLVKGHENVRHFSNHLNLPPDLVAEQYKQRWKIELFFK